MGPGEKLAAFARKTLRLAFASAGVSIALGVFFIAFLALTLSLTSDARIIANLRQASIAETLPQHSYPTSTFGHSGHQFDAYTDCVALGINLGNEGENVFRRIAESSTATRETGNGPCRELNDGARNGQLSTDYGYLRFWHGYQAYFRVLLSIVPFDAMMRITALLFFSALIFFALVKLATGYAGMGYIVLAHTAFCVPFAFLPIRGRLEDMDRSLETAAADLGLVAGATYPAELVTIREVAPDLLILVPGIGSQAGDLAAALDAGLDASGGGLLINSSRSVTYASQDRDFATAAGNAAKTLRDQINAIRG